MHTDTLIIWLRMILRKLLHKSAGPKTYSYHSQWALRHLAGAPPACSDARKTVVHNWQCQAVTQSA